MKSKSIIACTATSVALAVGSYWPGRFVAAERTGEFLSLLLTASGAILAISGVWVGLVFPRVLQSILSGKAGQEDPVDVIMTKHLQDAMMCSAAVLACCLAWFPATAVLRTFAWEPSTILVFRGLGFSFAVLLMCVEVVALLMVMALGDEVRQSGPGDGGASEATKDQADAPARERAAKAKTGHIKEVDRPLARATHGASKTGTVRK